MLEQKVHHYFLLKRSKKTKGKLLPIYLRITIDGIRKEVCTGRAVSADQWNHEVKRVDGIKEDARSINAYLDALNTKLLDACRNLIGRNERFTAESLIRLVKRSGESPQMLLKIFQLHNDEIKSLVGKDYAAGTLQRYKTSHEHTKNFIMWKYGVADIGVKKLDFEFVSQYELWLKTVKNCSHNTTMKYIRNFRKIVNRCIRHGSLDRDPFVGFKMTTREVFPEFLTAHELDKITSQKFVSDRLTQVRDIFLFCCYTGLAFADVEKLMPDEISTGIDGHKWIFSVRRKTGTLSRIPLLPIAITILEKYDNYQNLIQPKRVLPVVSNQKFNEYLKEIALICGITKKLTSHMARHTFATTITLSNGVPMESVSKMLGHKNIRTTQHYAKVLDTKIGDDMNILKQKLKLREAAI